MRLKNLFIVFLCCASLIGCKKTNWYESFKERSKEPFGTYILYNESKELFDNQEVVLLKENVYDYLNNTYFQEDYTFNYICVKNDAMRLTGDGLKELLLYVEEGSNAFFSLNRFSDALQDALEFETTNEDLLHFNASHLKTLKGDLRLENNEFEETEFSYDRNLRRNYFSSFKENNTIVLGTQEINGEDKPVFIKVYYGQGAIYLHSQPIALTNYNLLNENYKYAENILSYLPNKDVLWDPQVRWSQINNDEDNEDQESASMLALFWGNPSLRWSLYIVIFGFLTFILFNARRKQRPIPIIEAPKNSTLEFTHTISNLYLLNEDHKNLVQKKIQFFLEKVRSRYYLDTQNLNKDFMEKLALKSGNELSNTKYLINSILALNKKENCSAEDLMTLNKMIDNFLKRK